jgi:hypothetical protein
MRLHDVDDDTEPAPRGPGTRRSDRRDVVTESIDGRLGHLRVDVRGVLTEVDLNEQALRVMRPDRVAEYLVAAINRAEARAERQSADMSRQLLRRERP